MIKRLTAYIGADDWFHETWEHNGKTYETMVPPKLGGDSENPQKEWDGALSARLAEMVARRSDALGHSDGEPYDPRIDDR